MARSPTSGQMPGEPRGKDHRISPRPPITVAVGRFEDIVARGLTSLIRDDDNLALVATGVDAEDFAATLERQQPDVAIVNFGSLKNAAQIRDLHDTFPHTRLLVLANRPTPTESRQLLAFGATACLAKSSQARDLLHAIHLASRGLHLLPPIDAASGGSSSAGVDGSSGPELLTPRESEVLERLRAGDSNAQIAAALHVSIETVRTHARRVYRKLGVKTRRELVERR
jgi:DNA-binding NarL/FixJ family response regulator